MRSKKTIVLVTCSAVLAGCVPHWDMQGQNPKEYYAKNPIENRVETRHYTQTLDLSSFEMQAAERQALQAQIAKISPMAIESVEVQLHPSQLRNTQRNENIRRMLTRTGISRKLITYVAAEDVSVTEANIQLGYAAVVLPRCPDWRSSSVTSYANTMYTGNISCASRTNLGLMVADPRDLVEGEGDGTPDTNVTTRAIQQYRTASPEAGSTSGGGASAPESSTTGQ